MKNYLITLLIIFISSCKCYHSNENIKNINAENTVNYKIYKIDSLNSYYLIYAKKEELLYKIVSKKSNKDGCLKIKINSIYALKLRSMEIMKPKIEDPKKRPMNYLDFIEPCRKFDDSTKICLERYMTDLYFVDNVKGLCLIKE
jgi:hypothetical protein